LKAPVDSGAEETLLAVEQGLFPDDADGERRGPGDRGDGNHRGWKPRRPSPQRERAASRGEAVDRHPAQRVGIVVLESDAGEKDHEQDPVGEPPEFMGHGASSREVAEIVA
jgi:hypothetical protein